MRTYPIHRGRVATLSNLLSIIRLLLAAPIVYLLSFNAAPYNRWAVVLTLVAGATDFFDGQIARLRDTVSDLGKYLDPFADKVLVGALAVYLAFYRGNMPDWFAVLIVAKDLLIVIGGSVLMTRGVVGQAEGPGKYTVCAVIVVIATYMLNLDAVGRWAILPAILLTLYSTYFYYLKFLRLLEPEAGLVLRAVLPGILTLAAVTALALALSC